MTNYRLRWTNSRGEFEVEGPLDFVEKYVASFDAALSDPRPPSDERPRQRTPPAAVSSFGELFAEAPREMTDVEKALLAGWFIQEASSDKAFTTSDVSRVLMDQGIKLANASESIRRAIQAKNAFALEKGKYRISAAGAARVDELRRGQSIEKP